MMNPLNLICSLLLFSSSNLAPAIQLNECTLRIRGFETDQGKAFIKVIDMNNQPIQTIVLPISGKQVTCKLDVGGHTKIAIQVFHDINANKKLDKNMFGAPAEPWGISGSTRPSFRAPTLEEMLVPVQKDIEITIK